MSKYAETFRAAIRGWLPHGCCPCEVEVRNWGVPGCARWALVLTHSLRTRDEHGNPTMGDRFLDECDTHAHAVGKAAALDSQFDRLFRQMRLAYVTSKVADYLPGWSVVEKGRTVWLVFHADDKRPGELQLKVKAVARHDGFGDYVEVQLPGSVSQFSFEANPKTVASRLRKKLEPIVRALGGEHWA